MSISDSVRKWFGLDRFAFDSIVIKKNVIADIMQLAKEAYPNEFIAMLSGEVKDKKMIVSSLLLQQSRTSQREAHMNIWNIPMTSEMIGSVHSHPGGSNRPSKQDLQFFNKHQGVHLIICKPFMRKDIKVYNSYGREMELKLE